MAVNPDNLIEKFARMLEDGEHLDSSAFADRAIEIIAMISVEPSLNETLNRINAKLRAIFSNAADIKFDAFALGKSAKTTAANEIRALKQIKHTEALH